MSESPIFQIDYKFPYSLIWIKMLIVDSFKVDHHLVSIEVVIWRVFKTFTNNLFFLSFKFSFLAQYSVESEAGKTF